MIIRYSAEAHSLHIEWLDEILVFLLYWSDSPAWREREREEADSADIVLGVHSAVMTPAWLFALMGAYCSSLLTSVATPAYTAISTPSRRLLYV